MKITVGICAYNESNRNLQLLIKKYLEELKDELEEIIVVGNTNGEYRADKVVFIYEKERRGKSRAINSILRLAKGDVIVISDADIMPIDGSIKALIKPLRDGYGASCPRPIPTVKEGLIGFLNEVIYRVQLDANSNEEFFHLPGKITVVRKGVVREIPEDTINDDALIGLYSLMKGFRNKYVKESKVLFHPPQNLVEHLKQRKRIFLGHLQLWRRYGVVVPSMNPITVFLKIRKVFNRLTPTETLYFMIGIVLEAIARAWGLLAFILGSNDDKWDIANSTKWGF